MRRTVAQNKADSMFLINFLMTLGLALQKLIAEEGPISLARATSLTGVESFWDPVML